MSEINIFPGIKLNFLSTNTEDFHTHKDLDHVLEINYCKKGRIGWEMGTGNKVFLGHGDFSIHTMKSCASSNIFLPTGFYEGLTISLDTNILAKNPPEFFKSNNVKIEEIYDAFCQDENISSFAGNEETEAIFSYFYHQPDQVQTAYYKLKTIEIILYLLKQKNQTHNLLNEVHAEQTEIVRKIHTLMLNNLNQRFTIDYLSKKYLMNPTTLKNVFKTIYGDSIASHMKKHRLEYAAKELITSSKTLAEISLEIGYENQSKFSAAFKELYHMTPREYRKEKQQ